MFDVIKKVQIQQQQKKMQSQNPLYDPGLEPKNKGTVIRPSRQMILTKAVKRVHDVYFMC